MNITDEELKNKPYLTPNEVAQWMMVSPVTVRGWAQRGLLQAEVTPGGHRRFRREEVERFARQTNPAGNRGPLRVLIVDDDRSVVGFLTELLEGAADPITVEVAYDGFEAGSKVHAFVPDVVLLDYMMPGMKGPEVCQRILAIPGLSHVRVIAMSGLLSPQSEAELLTAGAECCLTKPIDTARLLALLDVKH